jgi:hypothetical protein
VPDSTVGTSCFTWMRCSARQRRQHAGPIRREFRQLPGFLQQAGAVAIRQRGQQRLDAVAIDRAQHRRHRGRVEAATSDARPGVGNRLVEQRQAIAQAAIGSGGQLADRGLVCFDASAAISW